MLELITHKGDQVSAFFGDFITAARKVLFIGTLGFNDLCLHFPLALAGFPEVDYLFLVEERPDVAEVLKLSATRNRSVLEAALTQRRFKFVPIEIVAADTANVAGRRATRECASYLAAGYTDVIVDATAMSRGVCFPIVKLFYDQSMKPSGPSAHVVTAGTRFPTIRAQSTSSDAPQYIHGFHGDMDTDEFDGAIKLWIPQLHEGSIASLRRIHEKLQPDEACLVLPFPSADPRRGDLLLREFKVPILEDWSVNLLDVIYAHESDPTDVCESITRIHNGRRQAFEASVKEPTCTVLSPAGSRIGSVGMLFAALRLNLPIMYEESMGYTSSETTVPDLSERPPDHLWHAWLRP